MFSEWINAQSSIELARIGSDRKDLRLKAPPTVQKEKTGSSFNQTASQTPHQKSPETSYVQRAERKESPPCVICKYIEPTKSPDHSTAECKILKSPRNHGKLDVDKRWQLLKEHRICFTCLGPAHDYRDCMTARTYCQDCQVSHNREIPCGSRIISSGRFGNTAGGRGRGSSYGSNINRQQ